MSSDTSNAASGAQDAGISQVSQALEGLPCDVENVVTMYCVSCHGSHPIGPMSLLSYSDFAAPSRTQPSKTVAQLSLELMHSTTNPMPPSGARPSASNLQTFATWVNAGTPKGACVTQNDAGSGNVSPTGPTLADGGAGAVVPGLPCDVSTLLAEYCVSCHATQPIGGAPMPLMTYADLTAPDPRDNTKTVAQASLDRMHNSTMPMPPAGPQPSAALVQAFSDWVAMGTPETGCGNADAGAVMPVDPYGTPLVCTSGVYSRASEGGDMRPGEACISCHAREFEAPKFAIAGTVFPTAHEPDSCEGTSAAPTIEITDANGGVHRLTANSVGTFYSQTQIALPYTAKVTYQGRTRAMVESQQSGDCNSCHTASGTSGAPGRIMLP